MAGKLTNVLGLPQPIADAVANDEYSRGASDISVTQLIDPPRKVELERRHAEEIEEDVADRIYALFGQAIHTILERANRTGDVEDRLFARVNDWMVSGQFDRVALAENGTGEVTLQDWKTAKVSEIIYGIKPERERQLNLLAFLARLHDYNIDAIEAVFILRDWSKVRASKGGGYPQKQVVVAPLPLWSNDQAAAYMAERVALHKAVREGAVPLPECTEEDRWAKPDQWAVMKPGRKSAVRVLDWEAEAYAYINQKEVKGGYVERRPGESLRCEFYCSAAQVCSQWQAIKQQRGEDAD